jgi:hypothetical protein
MKAVKRQVLADLIEERINTDIAELSVRAWAMYFDGLACGDGCGIGILLVSPRGAVSDPRLRDCVHNIVHTGIGDRTCPIPYLCCTLLACEVELVDTKGNYSSCTRVRFLS